MTQVVIGFIIVLVGFVIAFGVSRSLDTKREQSAAKAAGFTLSAIGFITIALCPLAIVEAGHRGVVITFGTVSPDTLSEGLHYVNPLASIKER
jgi:prohibitin 1